MKNNKTESSVTFSDGEESDSSKSEIYKFDNVGNVVQRVGLYSLML